MPVMPHTRNKNIAAFSPSGAVRQSDTFRGDIQGLRAIAVGAVMLFHVNKEWLPDGFLGVDVFFVISGFLIASMILRQKDSGSFSFSDFYIGRARRIVPAYLVLLIIVSFCSALLLIPKDFGFFWSSAKSALFFASNQYFSGFGNYFAPNSYELPLLHTWSLAVEMQYYLIFPLVMLLPERYLKFLLPGAIVFLVYEVFRLTDSGQQQTIYFSLVARVPEFLIGAGLSFWERGRNLDNYNQSHFKSHSNAIGFTGASLLISSFVWIDEGTVFPGLAALLPCIGAVSLIAARGSHFSRVLAHPVLVWIGGLSYSLYLWHWPILALLRYVTESYRLSAFNLIVFAVLTLALSYLSWRLIEVPFRRKAVRRRLLVGRIALLSLGVVLAVTLASRVSETLEKPLPIEFTRYAPANEICHGKIVGDCYRGDGASKFPTVLVLGDSHAAQLNYFFDVVGQANHQRFRVITASGCVTIPGFDVERLAEWARAACVSQIKAASQYLNETSTVVVAGIWRHHVNSQQFMQAFNNFLGDADTRGQKVIVLAQIPMLTSNVQRLRRFHVLGFKTNVSRDPKWLNANSKVERIVSRYSQARFVDFSGDNFFAKAPYESETLIYLDSHHLNEIGARGYGLRSALYFKELL